MMRAENKTWRDTYATATKPQRPFEPVRKSRLRSMQVYNHFGLLWSASRNVVGTCPTMCSSSEIEFRTINHLLHPLEAVDRTVDSKKLRPDPAKMVKEYTRSAAGTSHMSPSCLRPTTVLLSTVSYLIDLYEMEKQFGFSLVYSFVCDRLRSVRQDMIIQSLPPREVIQLLEEMIPFYIDSLYICLTNDYPSFDWKLHSTQLQECLTRWAECLPFVSPKEVNQEIVLSYLLQNNSEFTFTPSSLQFLNVYLRRDFRRPVLNLISSIVHGNYVRFFKSLSELPNGMVRKSAIHLIFRMRIHGLKTVAIGYKSPPSRIPVDKIAKWLSLDCTRDLCDVLHSFKIPEEELISVPLLSKFDENELSKQDVHTLYKCDKLLST